MNKWDQRYSAADFVYGKQPNAFLAKHAALIPAGPVLCLADGEGRNGVHLAKLGHPVTSLDSSSIGLRKAQQLAAENKVSLETLCCDLAAFTFPAKTYSGIVSIFCHLPPALRKSTYSQVAQSLQPGGVFILEAYTPAQLQHGTGGPPVPELLVSINQLRQELPGLEITLAHEIERDVTEGSLHTGTGAVAQLIAVKK